jgi:phosphocarrier protein
MKKTDSTLSREVMIQNELGLHARPAAKVAELARNASSRVWITKEAETVDAASIIDLLTLACAKGTRIIIEIEHQTDTDILSEIADLVEQGFGE